MFFCIEFSRAQVWRALDLMSHPLNAGFKDIYDSIGDWKLDKSSKRYIGMCMCTLQQFRYVFVVCCAGCSASCTSVLVVGGGCFEFNHCFFVSSQGCWNQRFGRIVYYQWGFVGRAISWSQCRGFFTSTGMGGRHKCWKGKNMWGCCICCTITDGIFLCLFFFSSWNPITCGILPLVVSIVWEV